MKELLLHESTRTHLDNYLKSPAHAIVLIGSGGSGKKTLAASLAEAVLGLESGGLAAYPYKLIAGPESGPSIGIEAVRAMENFLGLKVPGKASLNRVIIIKDSHLLTHEAQNSLLKTLEEPPVGTVIIMTVNHEQALLPTVRSRVQAVIVKRPSEIAATQYFKDLGFSEKEIQRAYTISGGLPGLMRALLEQEEHPLTAASERAKQLLRQPVFERLLSVDELSKQKDLTMNILFILQQMAHVSLKKPAGPLTARWQKVLEASYNAAEALNANAQPKLVITNLMLEL